MFFEKNHFEDIVGNGTCSVQRLDSSSLISLDMLLLSSKFLFLLIYYYLRSYVTNKIFKDGCECVESVLLAMEFFFKES